MKKSVFILVISLFLLVGCNNQEETIKNEYLAMKNSILDESKYQKKNPEVELPLDITVYVDRVGEEMIDYKVVFSNPKENMYQLKAMVIHNFYNEDVYPSIGVFDSPKDWLIMVEDTESPEQTTLELKGTIQTTKNISKLNLELKIWLSYVDDNGEKKDIYYKSL